MEAKSPGTPVKIGQRIMFDHLLSKGDHTILIMWGKPNKPIKIQLETSDKQVLKFEGKEANLDMIRMIVKNWFEVANKK